MKFKEANKWWFTIWPHICKDTRSIQLGIFLLSNHMMVADHGVATSPYMLKASRVTMHRLVEKQLVWGIQVFSTPHQHSRNVYKVPIELMRKGRLGFNPKWKQEARRKGETSSGHKKKLKGCFKCEARKALESACHWSKAMIQSLWVPQHHHKAHKLTGQSLGWEACTLFLSVVLSQRVFYA